MSTIIDTTGGFIADTMEVLANVAQMLDEMRIERGRHPTLEWTDWNEQQRSLITNLLLRGHALQQEAGSPPGKFSV